MESLAHLIYASAAVKPFAHSQLVALLEQAQTANGTVGVTGMLLYADGSFFQILEGNDAVLDTVFAKISRDPRHSNCVTIIREPIQCRDFADWSMGFASMTASEVAGLVGMNDFFTDGSCFSQLNAGRAHKLLDAFARGRWHIHSANAA